MSCLMDDANWPPFCLSSMRMKSFSRRPLMEHVTIWSDKWKSSRLSLCQHSSTLMIISRFIQSHAKTNHLNLLTFVCMCVAWIAELMVSVHFFSPLFFSGVQEVVMQTAYTEMITSDLLLLLVACVTDNLHLLYKIKPIQIPRRFCDGVFPKAWQHEFQHAKTVEWVSFWNSRLIWILQWFPETWHVNLWQRWYSQITVICFLREQRIIIFQAIVNFLNPW